MFQLDRVLRKLLVFFEGTENNYWLQFAFETIFAALLSATLSAFNGYFTVRTYYRVYTLDYTLNDGWCL